MKNIHLCFLAITLIGLQACQPETSSDNAAQPTQNSTVDQAAQQIDEREFMQHVAVLASDEFEGRAPATPGGIKTVEYLESAFKSLGLEPAFGESYRQALSLLELNITNAPALSIKHFDGSTDELPYKDSSVVFTSHNQAKVELNDSELVFVGYGIVAPEYGWNDYEGIDMTGKTAVILVNDPGYRQPRGELFKGLTMTYYGRWTYKYEEAARQGAAGAIVIHETGAAGYPWAVVSGSWSGPQYSLAESAGDKTSLKMEAWIKQDAAQALFSKNGLDYVALVERASRGELKPIPINSSVSVDMKLASRTSDSFNVGAVLKGRSRPEENFIYTAHWDHLGIKEVPEGRDAIFNGAQDNATGTAALLELAQAFKALPQAPERSVLFLAVTAEESGLLGSQAYAQAPAFPMNKTVAGINFDSMSTIGAADDVVVIGYGNSEMDDYLRQAVKSQNREVVPESTPEKGFFYRSDHFNLAKKGVPMLYAKSGEKIRDKPKGYGVKQSNKYIYERYHKASDEVHAEWDNGGIMQDLDAHFRIGVMISDSNDWPQWSAGNEFKAIRKASLAAE